MTTKKVIPRATVALKAAKIIIFSSFGSMKYHTIHFIWNKEHIIVKSQFNSNLLTDHRQDALLEDHHGVLCLPQDVGAQPHDI